MLAKSVTRVVTCLSLTAAQRHPRKRPGKKGRRRSRTIATRRLSKEELALAEELSVVEIDLPVSREVCGTGF